MAAASVAIFIVLNGLLLASAFPQYGPPQGAASYNQGAAPPAPPPPPPPPQQSYGQPAGGNSYGGNSGSSGNQGLTVQCKASPDSTGKIKYDCAGADKNAITLKTEHFLWLENSASQNQNLDVEIPNYNIDEFIKAAFKQLGPQEGAKINILLKKPDVTYNAEKDQPSAQQQPSPAVSLNYQPVDKISVHYPTQKQYSNSGRSAPPPPSSGSQYGQGPAQASSQYNQAPPAPSNSQYNQAPPAPSASQYNQAPPAPSSSQYNQAPPASSSQYSQGPASGAYSRPQRESESQQYFYLHQ